MDKRRILILTTSYLPLIGGSELAIHEITKRLPEFFFDIVTGRLDDKSRSYENSGGNIVIHRVGTIASRINFMLPKIFLPIAIFIKAFQLMRSNHFGAVHAWQASQAAGAAYMLSFLFPKTPYIVTLQEGKELDKQNWLIRFLRRCILRRANRIISISSFLDAYAQRQAPGIKTDLIPNGTTVIAGIVKFEARESQTSNKWY